MRRASLTIVAVIGVMGAASSASAQLLWSQPADDMSLAGAGSNVNSTIDSALHADNFIIAESSVITGIDWVGYVYNGGTPADIGGFWIEIYSDSDLAAGIFGTPGNLRYSALLPVEAPWIVAEVVGAGWLSQTFYRYSVETSIALPPGEYWLHIAASMSDTGRAFGWAKHFGEDGDGIAARAFVSTGSVFSQITGSVDLAFELSGGAATSIDDLIALISSQVMELDLGAFDAPNANAARGRRGALANQFGVVIRHIENEAYGDALSKLEDLSAKIDEWLLESPERDVLHQLVADLTAIIAGLI